MSTTSDQLGQQAKEVTEDLQKMGGTVRDAAQEKLGHVGEKASEYCERGRKKSTAPRAPASSSSGKGRCGPYCLRQASAGCSVAFGSTANRVVERAVLAPVNCVEETAEEVMIRGESIGSP